MKPPTPPLPLLRRRHRRLVAVVINNTHTAPSLTLSAQLRGPSVHDGVVRHDDAACRQRSHPYLSFNHSMYCDDCTNQALTALLYKYVLQPPAFEIDAHVVSDAYFGEPLGKLLSIK